MRRGWKRRDILRGLDGVGVGVGGQLGGLNRMEDN
jgi:hypothetical protein